MNTIDLENNFFDRKSILDLLKRRVIDLKEGYRQNIAFLGDRHIGKSSILQKFVHDLDEEGIIDIYLDLENKDFNYFYSKFAGSILYNFSKSKKLNLYDDLNLLMESTRKFIPQTVEEIKKIQASVAKGRLVEAYRDLIALPEIFTLESGKFCVIILDEFHNLEELTISNIFQELGKKIMTQKRCLYIVTSSLGTVAKEILSEKLSLLFGHFEIIPIGPFDLRTSQLFVEHNLKSIRISPALRNFLIDFTGGHPFYLNIISQELIHLCALHGQSEIFTPLLTQAVENTIFNRWGVLSRHFELIAHNLSVSKGNRSVLSILIALANGKHKLSEIVEAVGLGKSFVSLKLNRLMELSIVVKNGNFYCLADKLLRYWIKYVLQKRLKTIDAYTENLRSQFAVEISSLVADFKNISEKDLSTRIVELLHCFDNESFRLNGRRYKLPLFSEIMPVKLGSGVSDGIEVIKACASEGVWFIVLKEGGLGENELNLFLSQSKQLTKKPQQRVIVSLNDLEANARLRALQEKMWIWSEGELNTLLSLYDKPYIMK